VCRFRYLLQHLADGIPDTIFRLDLLPEFGGGAYGAPHGLELPLDGCDLFALRGVDWQQLDRRDWRALGTRPERVEDSCRRTPLRSSSGSCRRLRFEFKRTPSPAATWSRHTAMGDLGLSELGVVHAGERSGHLARGSRTVAFGRLSDDATPLRER